MKTNKAEMIELKAWITHALGVGTVPPEVMGALSRMTAIDVARVTAWLREIIVRKAQERLDAEIALEATDPSLNVDKV